MPSVPRALPVLVVALPLLLGCPGARAPAPRPAPTPSPAAVSVTVTVPAAPAEPIAVLLESLPVVEGAVTLRAARGAVGAYAPFPFHAFVEGVHAVDGAGRELDVASPEPGVYRVDAGAAEAVRVAYRVDGARSERELGDFMVSTHRRQGFTLLSGYATFLMVDGAEELPHRVRLRLPEGWRAAWALPRGEDGRYEAASSFELVDEPAMLGARVLSLPVPEGSAAPVGWVHVWSAVDEEPPQGPALVAATETALAAMRVLGLPPLGRPYHVFFEYHPEDLGRELGWALEHGASMHGADTADRHHEGSARLAYHVTHHLLHAWLPRRLFTDRLRPDRQLRLETSECVWFAEGFAQYLAFVGMGRAEAAPPDVLLSMLSRRFVQPFRQGTPGAPRSMAELSLELSSGQHDHWVFGFAEGALFALWLDELMAAGDGSGDLAGAMARLFEGRGGGGAAGISEADLEGVLAEATGLELGTVWESHVQGREPLPLETISTHAGLRLAGGEVELLPDEERTEEVRRFVSSRFGPLRLQPGDRVVYRYTGTFTAELVRLTERILSREGDRLEIEVTAERGEERRVWVQVVTDTLANRRANVVDALYEVGPDGERRQLPNEDNRDVMRLYEWTVPQLDGPPSEMRHAEEIVQVVGRPQRCLGETMRVSSGGRPAWMTHAVCPRFLWRHGPATLVDEESRSVIWQMEVLESSR